MITSMTLGEATDLLAIGGWPCACTGPWPVCNCMRIFVEARQLQRGAHIAVKQLADHHARLAGEPTEVS